MYRDLKIKKLISLYNENIINYSSSASNEEEKLIELRKLLREILLNFVDKLPVIETDSILAEIETLELLIFMEVTNYKPNNILE